MNGKFLPTECPCCGAYSLTHDQQASTLLAVCDVLVLKTLETIGKYILKEDRSRFSEAEGIPRYLIHTEWPITDDVAAKLLKGAWVIVPLIVGTYGCAGVSADKITNMLDSYIHDLVITKTQHSKEELQYRFNSRLGIPVYLKGKEEDYARVI